MAGIAKNLGGQVAGVGCLLFFVVFWSAITLTFDFLIAKASIHQIHALGYSTAIGTITSSEVEANDDGDGTTYRPVIKYFYVAGDQRYEGDRYRYGQMGTGDRSAHRIVESYPVGRQVEVHYAPHYPADAVLRVGLEGLDLFVMMFMLPFNLIMLGLWLAILGGVRYRLSRPVAGGAKVIDDGRHLRVRLSPQKPFLIGVAASGGVAFILVFVVGFAFGFNAPMVVMVAAWGLILGGGGIAWLQVHRRLARGDSDLLIDEFRSSLTLPRTFGRQGDVVVPSGRIVAIEVAHEEKPDSDGDTHYRYVPVVVFTDDDGPQRREKLIEWRDESSAEQLVEWLRERFRVKPSSES